MPSPIYILSAALLDRHDNAIYLGLRHADLVKQCITARRDYPTSLVFGFADSEGNFLTRKEALPVALRAGQYGQGLEPVGNGIELHSEDCW